MSVQTALSPPPVHPAAQLHVNLFRPLWHWELPPQVMPLHCGEVVQASESGSTQLACGGAA